MSEDPPLPYQGQGPEVIPESDERVHQELIDYFKKFPWGSIVGRLGDLKYLEVKNGIVVRPGPNDITLPRWVAKVDYVLVDKSKDRWDVNLYDKDGKIRAIVEMKGDEILGFIDRHVNKNGEAFTRSVKMVDSLNAVMEGLKNRKMIKELPLKNAKGKVVKKRRDRWVYAVPKKLMKEATKELQKLEKNDYEYEIEMRHNNFESLPPVLVVRRFKYVKRSEDVDGGDIVEKRPVDVRKVVWSGDKENGFELVMFYKKGADYDENAEEIPISNIKTTVSYDGKVEFKDTYANSKGFALRLAAFVAPILRAVNKSDEDKASKYDADQKQRDNLMNGGTLD